MIGGLLAVIMHPQVATSFNESLTAAALYGDMLINYAGEHPYSRIVYVLYLKSPGQRTVIERASQLNQLRAPIYITDIIICAAPPPAIPLPSCFNLQMDVANLMSIDLRPHCADRECDQKMPRRSFNHLLCSIGLSGHALLFKIET